MKQAMKEMLQEFIERDFSAYEMQQVIGAITDVEQDYKLLAIHRKHGDWQMTINDKHSIYNDTIDLGTLLESYSLDYSVDDLVDDGGVEL